MKFIGKPFSENLFTEFSASSREGYDGTDNRPSIWSERAERSSWRPVWHCDAVITGMITRRQDVLLISSLFNKLCTLRCALYQMETIEAIRKFRIFEALLAWVDFKLELQTKEHLFL